MLKLSHSSELELRVAPGIVLAMLVAAGVVLAIAGDLRTEPIPRLHLLLVALGFYSIAGIGWGLLIWRQEQVGWFVITALVILTAIGYGWTGIIGFLVLAGVPVIVASALHGPIVATATATAESVLFLLLRNVV
ncbi:hypothetical protein LCGC14_2940320, partial [marine sediment metagenome]